MTLNKPFYIIRHGQTEANAAQVMAGQCDTPLTDLGRNQALEAAKLMPSLDPYPDVILHSGLIRARDTAQALNKALNRTMQISPDWGEQHFGDWQGVPISIVQQQVRNGQTPPNGESREIFYRRIQQAAQETLAQHSCPLIVCHGGAIRALADGFGLKIQGVANCILYYFHPEPERAGFPYKVFEYQPDTGKRDLSACFENAYQLRMSPVSM